VKSDHLTVIQNQGVGSNNEIEDETEVPAKKVKQSKSASSATKEAASKRNYERLGQPAKPAKDEQLREPKAGSEAEEPAHDDPSFLNSSTLMAAPSGDVHSSSEIKENTKAGSEASKEQAQGVSFYINFSNFTAVPIGDVHSSSEVKEEGKAGSEVSEEAQDVSSYLNFTNFMTAPIGEEAEDAPVKLHSKAEHPGLAAYYHWKSTLTSLYRVYAVPLHSYPHTSYGTNNRVKEAVLPMHPSSERGQTAVYIEVTNFTPHDIAVYWVDYRGNEKYKGRMRPSEVWHQTTYIGHPWTFRKIQDGMDTASDKSILLKYVPFKVIPSIEGAETVTEYDDSQGEPVAMQRFALKEVPADFGVTVEGQKWRPACYVEDAILPEPPLVSLLGEIDSGESRSGGKNGTCCSVLLPKVCCFLISQSILPPEHRTIN
jgi:hypothetical protein